MAASEGLFDFPLQNNHHNSFFISDVLLHSKAPNPVLEAQGPSATANCMLPALVKRLARFPAATANNQDVVFLGSLSFKIPCNEH